MMGIDKGQQIRLTICGVIGIATPIASLILTGMIGIPVILIMGTVGIISALDQNRY